MMDLGLSGDQVRGSQQAGSSIESDLIEIFARNEVVVTGIGSRETPDDVLALMTRIGSKLEKMGAILRSGGAGGADIAFERGYRNAAQCEIFHPWRGFVPKKGMTSADMAKLLGRMRPERGAGSPIVIDGATLKAAEETAKRYHPCWQKCGQGARKLHTRNVPQVMGARLNRLTDLVICWTVDGRASGGTGQAMRMAEHLGVRIVNLKRQSDRAAILKVLGIAE